MSRKFAEFLAEQGIVWSALDSTDQRQLRLDLSDTRCEDVSLTVQADRNEVDINKIVERHRNAGIPLPPANLQFGDGTALLSYEEALAAVSRSREMFAALPSKVRLRFGNEPGEFLAFMRDPANLEESYELGVRKRPSVRQPPASPSPPAAPAVPPSA